MIWLLIEMVCTLIFCQNYMICSISQSEQYRAKHQKSKERSLALLKANIDTVVAIGLLQLAPDTVTARVTGAFVFVSSLISCYQVLVFPETSRTYIHAQFKEFQLSSLSCCSCFPHHQNQKHPRRQVFDLAMNQCSHFSFRHFFRIVLSGGSRLRLHFSSIALVIRS